LPSRQNNSRVDSSFSGRVAVSGRIFGGRSSLFAVEVSEETGRGPWAGRYEIRELLGAGERKQVYLAHDLVMDRDVAVSLVPPEEPGPDGVSVTDWEARIMARLGDHPRIVTVYDVGVFEDQTFLVSQLMLGGELRAILRGRWRDAPPPLSRGARLGADIAEALSYAHSRNVVHRDVQPGNIWLDGRGDACLGDFDLATTPDRLEPPGADSTVTTAAYMPPEQIAGERSLPASDLYSLGATLYELVAGRPPFEGTRAELLHDHVNTQPKPPSRLRSELGGTFEDLILRLLVVCLVIGGCLGYDEACASLHPRLLSATSNDPSWKSCCVRTLRRTVMSNALACC
jgi:eukaryotic-like serine/threonine-protein kinase